MIVELLLTDRMSRQRILKSTKCKSFQPARFVNLLMSKDMSKLLDSYLSILLFLGRSVFGIFFKWSFSRFMQWGYVVITTPEGVLDHEEAVKRNVGGQVLGYFH